LDAPALSVI
jgi:hypothetical protein